MKKIKEILKERKNGFLLLFFAGSIAVAFSVFSQKAVSQEVRQSSQQEERVLAEEDAKDENSSLEENFEERNQQVEENSQEQTSSEAGESSLEEDQETDKPDPEEVRYEELKEHLKKYCGKKYDVKKCREYLLEAKDLSKKGKEFKDLYEKYHFVKKKKDKKKDEKKDDASDSQSLLKALRVVSGGKEKSFEIEAVSGMNVIEFMKKGGISYDTLSSGLIDDVDGQGKTSGNMSWMLYLCRDGQCKLSSVGAEECEIDNWDKIEWRFVDWTQITSWESW